MFWGWLGMFWGYSVDRSDTVQDFTSKKKNITTTINWLQQRLMGVWYIQKWLIPIAGVNTR